MSMSTRPRRAFWGDTRFLIGIVLVITSIAGVWFVVASAGSTAPILQASRTIVPGEPVTSDDVRIVEVDLGTLASVYLAPHALEPGVVAARTVREGELIPAAATAPAASSRSTTVVIESTTGIPDGMTPGTTVEIWHAPPLDDAEHDAPRILVADAVIASIDEHEGMLAADGAAVEVVIDRADVAAVLSAITGGSLLSVVPTAVSP